MNTNPQMNFQLTQEPFLIQQAEKKVSRTYAMLLVICLCSVVFLQQGLAATYYSKVATGNMNAVASWTADTVLNPNGAALTAADLFVIRNAHNITLSANQSAASVIVRSGGTLTIGGNFTLTVPLTTINLGGLLSIGASRLVLAGSWTNNGSISGTNGRLTYNTGTGINNGSLAFTTTGSQLVQTSGSLTNGATGTIAITGAATISLGTGNFINNNTASSVNFGTSAITVSGTANPQEIGGFVTTGRFTCSKTSGTLTVNGDINCGGLTKSNAGILDLGTGRTMNCSNTVILTAGTLNGGSSTLNVSFVSTTVWQGTGTVFVPQTSTVNFNAAGNQTLSATGTKTFYNLTFSNSGTKTNATTTVTNILSMEGTATASAAPTYGASATLRYNRTANQATGAEWPASLSNTSGGVVIDNTGDITLGAAKTLGAGTPLTVNSGAVLEMSTFLLTLSSDFINNSGTLNGGTGGVTITGADPQSIGAFTTTGTISSTKTAGTAIFTGNVSGGGLTINNTGTGILNLGVGLTHSTGTFVRTAGTLEGNTSTLNISGAITNTAGTFTANTGTVNFTGAAGQAVPSLTYYNLGFSGAGTKTIATATTIVVTNNWAVGSSTTMTGTAGADVTGNITGSGVITMNTGTITIQGNWTNNGAFVCNTGTVNYNGSTQTIAALTYNNLQTSNAGVKTMAGNTTVNSVLTINATSELNLSSVTVTLAGAGTPITGTGTFTAATSTVNYTNAGSTVIVAVAYNNLNGTGGARTLSPTGTIGIRGTFTPGGGAYTIVNSTVDFNGNGAQTIPAFTFHDLLVSNAGIKLIPASIIVACQTIDIKDNASVEINADGGGRLNVLM